jgi:DNA-binding MarR family transcriptional regulator
MKKFFNFKTVGNKPISTTVEDKGIILNVVKANERIAELQAENDALKQSSGNAQSNTEDVSPEEAQALQNIEHNLKTFNEQTKKANAIVSSISKTVANMSAENPIEKYRIEMAAKFAEAKAESDARLNRILGNDSPEAAAIKQYNEFTKSEREFTEMAPQAKMAQKVSSGFTYVEHAKPKPGIAPWFFVDKDYYLGYDNGIAYIQTLRSERAGGLPVIIIHSEKGISNPGTTWQGKDIYDKTIVNGKPVGWKPYPYKHLTRAEVDQIVRDKPSVDSITTMYQQLVNKAEVAFDVGKAVVVFG